MKTFKRLGAVALSVLALTGIVLACLHRVYGLTVGARGAMKWLPYGYSDLLIDYDGGFVRRGLLGTLLERVAHHGPALATTNEFLWYQYIALIVLCLVLACLAGRRWIVNAIFLLLVPGGLFSMGIGDTGFFRKETLFHVGLCLLAVLFLVRSRSSRAWVRLVAGWATYTLAVLFCLVLPMIHEAFVFLLLPAIALLVLATLKDDKIAEIAPRVLHQRKIPVFIFVLVGIAIAEFLLLSLFKGTPGIARTIWAHLALTDQAIIRPLGVPADAIDSLSWSASKGFLMAIEVLISGWAWYWLVPMVAGAAYCLTYVTLNLGDGNNARTTGVHWVEIYLALFACTIPLFVLGWDWGRWINSTNFTFLILYLAMSRTDITLVLKGLVPVRSEAVLVDGTQRARLLHVYARFYSFVSANKGFVVIGLIVLSQTLRVPECCMQNNDNMWVSLIKAWGKSRH